MCSVNGPRYQALNESPRLVRCGKPTWPVSVTSASGRGGFVGGGASPLGGGAQGGFSSAAISPGTVPSSPTSSPCISVANEPAPVQVNDQCASTGNRYVGSARIVSTGKR